MLPADQFAEIHSTRVRAIPISPPVVIAGSVIVPDHNATAGAQCLVAAFRDVA